MLSKDTNIILLYSSFEKEDVFKLKKMDIFKSLSNLKILETRTLLDLSHILKKVNLLFCMDSGPKHIAVALGTPTITLFSSESMGEFHPYNDTKHIALRSEVNCRPNYSQKKGFEWCGLSHCESMICMEQITPQKVYKKIINHLDRIKANS